MRLRVERIDGHRALVVREGELEFAEREQGVGPAIRSVARAGSIGKRSLEVRHRAARVAGRQPCEAHRLECFFGLAGSLDLVERGGKRFLGPTEGCIDHRQRRRPEHVPCAQRHGTFGGSRRLLEAVEPEQNIAPGAPGARVLRTERQRPSCQPHRLTVSMQQRSVDGVVGDQVRRPCGNVESAHSVRARLVEAPQKVEGVGPVLMNERKARPRGRRISETLDRLRKLSLPHEADALHVERPWSLGHVGMEQHVV